MKTFSDEELAKLRKYLEDKANALANEGRIRQVPYYPGKELLRDYLWTIVEVPDLGRIEMYFTIMSSILKINRVSVEVERVESFNFKQINDILLDALKQKTIADSRTWFDNI